METVSASDIVRQFGHWQDRALTAPVYIRHHGRAKLVLASIDFMERLIAERGGGDGSQQSIEALLDLVESMVIVTDARLCVKGMSPVAQHHFGRSDWRGESLEQLLPDQLRAIVMRSVVHVSATKQADAFQLRTGPNADRRMDVTIQPYGDGVCIVGHDRSASDARREAGALADAVRQTLDTLGSIAVLRINTRGFIIDANASFETLSGLSPEAYRSVRMPTLFDVATRVAVGDAFESAIEHVTPRHVAAKLIVNRGAPVDVRIAFSAEMLRSSIDVVIATILTNG